MTQILSLQNGIRTVTELGFILGNTEISFYFLNYGCDGFLYMSISVPAEFSDGCLQTGRAILRESESNYHIPRPMPAFRIYNISTQRGHTVVWNSKVRVNKRKSQLSSVWPPRAGWLGPCEVILFITLPSGRITVKPFKWDWWESIQFQRPAQKDAAQNSWDSTAAQPPSLLQLEPDSLVPSPWLTQRMWPWAVEGQLEIAPQPFVNILMPG